MVALKTSFRPAVPRDFREFHHSKSDPYGKVTVLAADGVTVRAESAYGNPWAFTGRRLDQETGLMQFRMRNYDVDLGRFVSRDPAGYVGPSLYASYFVPSGTDPSGLYGWTYTGKQFKKLVSSTHVSKLEWKMYAVRTTYDQECWMFGIYAFYQKPIWTFDVWREAVYSDVVDNLVQPLNVCSGACFAWSAKCGYCANLPGAFAFGIAGGGLQMASGIIDWSSMTGFKKWFYQGRRTEGGQWADTGIRSKFPKYKISDCPCKKEIPPRPILGLPNDLPPAPGSGPKQPTGPKQPSDGLVIGPRQPPDDVVIGPRQPEDLIIAPRQTGEMIIAPRQ